MVKYERFVVLGVVLGLMFVITIASIFIEQLRGMVAAFCIFLMVKYERFFVLGLMFVITIASIFIEQLQGMVAAFCIFLILLQVVTELDKTPAKEKVKNNG